MASELFNFLRSLELPEPKGILQVGASYGQEIQEFIDNNIDNALLIEPLTEPFAHLSKLCSSTPGYIAFNALCSEASGQSHKFHVASNGGQSSSIMEPHKHKELFEHVKFDHDVVISSTTVDEIISFLVQHNYSYITNNLDTLYMDVQGAEFKVLLGAPKTLQQINYIYTEIIRGDLYQGTQSLATYCSLLEAHGFTLNNLNYNKFHHADMFFVRKSVLGLV